MGVGGRSQRRRSQQQDEMLSTTVEESERLVRSAPTKCRTQKKEETEISSSGRSRASRGRRHVVDGAEQKQRIDRRGKQGTVTTAAGEEVRLPVAAGDSGRHRRGSGCRRHDSGRRRRGSDD
ncbi:hypothetical protein BHM03_00034642 [Ensete ventricosum]|nr:hypothetical protein BHM03_00034642 [Ensete ventricosum]